MLYSIETQKNTNRIKLSMKTIVMFMLILYLTDEWKNIENKMKKKKNMKNA